VLESGLQPEYGFLAHGARLEPMTTTCHILDAETLASWRAEAAVRNVGVVAGTFDILQPANLAALRAASRQCGKVCVLLTPSDSGAGSPWHSLPDRAELLSYLRDVDVTVSFQADDAAQFLQSLRPFTFFSCPECDADDLTRTAQAAADTTEPLPLLPGCSTSDIIEAIRNRKTPIELPQSIGGPVGGDSPGTVVTVNGCFDLLHLGHCRFLADARAMGDQLVILLNDDASVAKYKGSERPVFPAHFRSEALCSLGSVSRVQPFVEDDPLKALSRLKPAIHVKGGSYEEARMQRERDLLESWGGKLEFCPMTEGQSTSDLIRRVTRVE
jgi:rfaE bifunctional protein nucleotidyltransferase chain/domain